MNASKKLMDIVTANVARGRNQKSISEMMLEVMQDGSEYTRLELNVLLTQMRYEEQTGKELTDEMLDDTKPENAETIEEVTKLTKTIKNGLDTGISKSNNPSSFWFNPEFGDKGKGKYRLVERPGGKYTIETVISEEQSVNPSGETASEKPVKPQK